MKLSEAKTEDFSFASGGSLLSASDKSNQKRLSAHFAISNNTSLRSVLAKFEAEPKLLFKFIIRFYATVTAVPDAVIINILLFFPSVS